MCTVRYIAVMAQDKSTSPDEEERRDAMQLGKASYRVSVAGIVIGIIVTITVAVLLSKNGNYNYNYGD